MFYCEKDYVAKQSVLTIRIMVLSQAASQADTHLQSYGVRDQCVESDILVLRIPTARLLQQGYKAIIISGGGTKERKDVCDGQFEIQVETECLLFKGLETRQMVSVTHGRKMLHNFLFDICGLQEGFTLEKRKQQCNDYIQHMVGRDKIVLMLVSGGVDSAVCAALLHKALVQGYDSSRLQAINIDNGFLRKDESEQVVEASLTFRDASTNVHGRQSLLLCRTVVMDIVEPLEDFHKNEVRALCRELGPPAKLLERHPFPGPGLSIRIIYAEEPFLEADFDETQVLIRLMVHYVNTANEHVLLNRIEIAPLEEERLLLEELSSHNQYVATLLPIHTIGVQQ
ncbi:GMP synthase [glutamine-hydrolyzing] [Daphnia magna]|uniref:GMP synthase [glutamine-hydrolyzing] n=1 Tax=Daphnia magna TaxID=35525 RepID=UPI001E1BDA16|nr:GMP synthase [glutamine-hydrolyzing] [Daphnia magna]